MDYVGGELELFKHAQNWKTYCASMLRPHVHGRVLDVGCGLGVNADRLWNEAVTSYTFLEPDARLLEQVPANVTTEALRNEERINGTTVDLTGRQFDTILYIDVIEHIADAKAELQRAFDLLAPGGHLLILVPAFNYVYSEFDKAIGHHRRYTKGTLNEDLPLAMERITMRYLDSAGMLLSLGNKWFLTQDAPRLVQIQFWDRRIIPLSRVTDKLCFHRFGRSLVSISRKPAA